MSAGRASRAFGVPGHKPLHAPKGVMEGGQFVGRQSLLHKVVEKLLGMPERPQGGGSDVRRSMGRFTTAGGSHVSVSLPHRRPRIDDRVRDPHTGALGTVQTAHPDGTGRIAWDSGHVEVRNLDELAHPGQRDLPDPARNFDLTKGESPRKMDAAVTAGTPGRPRTAAEKMADAVAAGHVAPPVASQSGSPAVAKMTKAKAPGAKKLTAAELATMSVDDLERAHAEGRVTGPAAAKRLRMDAAGLGSSIEVALDGRPDSELPATTLARVNGYRAARADLLSRADAIDRSASKTPSPAVAKLAKAAPKATPPIADVTARLNSMPTEDAAREYLTGLGLDVAGLKTLAADLDVPLTNRTKAGIVNDIIHVRVSGRLTTEVFKKTFLASETAPGGRFGPAPAAQKMATLGAPMGRGHSQALGALDRLIASYGSDPVANEERMPGAASRMQTLHGARDALANGTRSPRDVEDILAHLHQHGGGGQFGASVAEEAQKLRDSLDSLRVPAAGRRSAAQKMATPKAALPELAARLRKMSTAEEISTALEHERLNAAELRQLAYEVNVSIPPAARSAAARRKYLGETLTEHRRRTGGGY